MKLFKGSTEIKSVFKNLMISVSDIFDATATNNKVLADEVFYNNDGRQEGTMPNVGAVSKSLSLGESYIIPEGYHPGTGRVTSPYIKLQTFYTGDSEPSADLGVVGDLYFMTDSTSSGDSGSSSTPTIISFSMTGDYNWQAEEGMTWGEWLNSDYATTNSRITFEFTDNRLEVYDAGKWWGTLTDQSETFIVLTDNIISGYEYWIV